MSLSNPRQTSPVTRYFRVSSGNGNVNHWDKSLSTEIVAPLPFRFVLLDTWNTIGGFHEASGSSIFSNEVRTNDDVLNVRSKTGTLVSGPYSAIKDRVRAVGGRFANSLYIAYEDGGMWKLGNLNLVGASLSAFFDFRQAGGGRDSDPGVAITGFTEATKGRTEYHIPTFERWTVGPDVLSIAEGLDRELQDYLSRRGAEKAEETAPQPTRLVSEAPF